MLLDGICDKLLDPTEFLEAFSYDM